ncbi:hypothetical protein Zmor_000019 [Zophobas morio]|uniref:Sphingomyelin phosphodiesterase n=1 Tax=Zophobas morio TaxID=2755281 RepID=A0AA38J058_9CUCU|nr:hypothetical protein Zmor_000019 [Zophobas morio]
MSLLKFSFFVLVLLHRFTSTNSNPDNFDLLKEELVELFTNGTIRSTLPQHLAPYQVPQLFDGTKQFPRNPLTCSLCKFVFKQAITLRKNGATRETILSTMKFLCVTMSFASDRVCTGLIDINAEVLFYLVDSGTKVLEKRICESLFQGWGCSRGRYRWSIQLPSQDFSLNTTTSTTTLGESFQILQLSDIHYDPDYQPYGNAYCHEPLCCQKDQGPALSSSSECGYWTDYNAADSPWHLIEETIRQAKTQNFKYVYFTGDIISHKVWDTSVSKNRDSILSLYSFFKEKFDVPVFPIFGNHEPHPVNLWAPRKVTGSLSTQWLFDLAAKSWSDLIGHNVTQTVLKGGYYSVSPEPGFRVIAINSNPCYTFNFWLIYDDTELKEQLQWLADTLKDAEDNDERVHILSHIPAGTSECLVAWDVQYSRIVQRGTKPTGVAFNGASVTPYSWSNPSYKIYDVDSTIFTLQDYSEWTFDLNQANSQPANQSIDWYKLYSFVEAYDVDSLEPDQVDFLLYKMVKNRSLVQDYYRFKYRDGDFPMKEGCNEECEDDNLCQITTTVFGDTAQCSRFLNMGRRSAGSGFHPGYLIVMSVVFSFRVFL